jgi:hypothetical protein
MKVPRARLNETRLLLPLCQKEYTQLVIQLGVAAELTNLVGRICRAELTGSHNLSRFADCCEFYIGPKLRTACAYMAEMRV